MQYTLPLPEVWCYKCDQYKDRSEFAKDRARPGGLRLECKVCQKDYRVKLKEDKHVKMRNV